MAESNSSTWGQLVRDIERRDLTKVQRSLESGACAHHIISEPGFDHFGSTPLSLAIASEDITLVRVVIDHSPPLTLQPAIENDHKLQEENWYVRAPVSENRPNSAERNYRLCWSDYQALDHSSIALASLLRTRGRLYAEEQDDAYHTRYKQEQIYRRADEHPDAEMSNSIASLETEELDEDPDAEVSNSIASVEIEELDEEYDVDFGAKVLILLVKAGLDLREAHRCDIGRSLWFWAIQEGHVQILRMFLDVRFPVDLRATKTGYHSRRSRAVAPLCTTGLWNAAFRAQIECLALLLKVGASVRPPEINRQDFPGPDKTRVPDLKYEPWSLSMSPLLAVAHGLYLRQIAYDEIWWRRSRRIIDRDRYSQTVVLLLEADADPNPETKTATPAGMYEHSPPTTSPLLLLVELGAGEAVAKLLDSGSVLSGFGEHERSALHLAVRSTSLEMTRLVFSRSIPCIPIDIRDEVGYTPLHECVLSGSLDIMTFLLERLESHAQVDPVSLVGLSPLWLAVVTKRKEMAELLLEKGADPNVDCSKHLSDISKPAQAQIELLVEYTTHNKSKSSKKDDTLFWAATPLLAALGGFRPAFFIRDFPASDSYKQDRLEELEIRLALVRLLLGRGASPMQEGLIARIEGFDSSRGLQVEKRALIWQAHFCVPVVHGVRVVFGSDQELSAMPAPSYQMIKELIWPVRSHLPRHLADRALQVACEMNLSEQNERYSSRQPNGIASYVLKLLLDCGANPNVRSNNGFLPLHNVCAAFPLNKEQIQDQLASVDLLLSAGARIQERDNHGRTPLHFAVLSSVEVTQVLLDRGLSPDDWDETRDTPMHYACGSKWTTVRLDTAAELCKYVRRASLIPVWWFRNGRKQNPFHALAELYEGPHDKHVQAVRTLLAFFEPHTNCLSQFDQSKQTPMHIAAKDPYYSSAGLLFLEAVCSESRPFDAYTTQDAEGKTPLIAAVLVRSKENVSTLLTGIKTARKVEKVDINIAPSPRDGDPFQFARFTIVKGRHATSPATHPLEHAQNERDTSGQTQCNRLDTMEDVHDPSEERAAGSDDAGSDTSHHSESSYNSSSLRVPRSHFPSHSERVKRLQNADLWSLRAQALNTRDNYGATALQHAVAGGHTDMVKLLLAEDGIDTICYDGKHATLLKLAASRRHREVVGLLRNVETKNITAGPVRVKAVKRFAVRPPRTTQTKATRRSLLLRQIWNFDFLYHLAICLVCVCSWLALKKYS